MSRPLSITLLPLLIALLAACSGSSGGDDNGNGNTPPTISTIADLSTPGGTTVGPIGFTVDDAETPAVDLVVTASSSNSTLLPDGGIFLAGSGTDRTVTLTPVDGQTGVAEITLTVTDADGATAVTVFLLTVTSGGIDFTDGAYLIIDVTAGPSAESYPTWEVGSVPADINSDNYKTNLIVLRHIPAGTYTQGSPEDELGRHDNEDQHEVTLTQDYYIGVFQVTQHQWLQVMGGSNPSQHTGDTRPVEQTNWEDVRGGTWDGPDGGAPDANTFIGRLASKTGLAIDLPTESQWEHAARAGTTSALNNGENLTGASSCTNLNALGRYAGNSGGGYHATVGSYARNAWGLYDMHGNVWEWCLDWWQESLGINPVTDPVGPTTGSYRVLRGGGWGSLAEFCRSAKRIGLLPIDIIDIAGFRLAAPVQPAGSPEGNN